MEIPIKMDDLGVPPFKETPIYIYIYKSLVFFVSLFLGPGVSGGDGFATLLGEGP